MTDAEFVAQLRARVEEYLRAMEAWEAEYQKYYRLAAPEQVSPDLAKLQQSFDEARNALRAQVPRARRMCLKHGIRNPFPAVFHVELGSMAPQSGHATALGRGERNALLESVMSIKHAVVEEELRGRGAPVKPLTSRGLLRRIYDFFFTLLIS